LDPVIQTIADSVALATPEVVLILTACGLFLGAAFHASRVLWAGGAGIGLLVAITLWLLMPLGSVDNPAASLFRADALTSLTRGLALLGGVVLLLLSWNQVAGTVAGEYYGCLLLIIAGTSLIGASNDLVSLFLALELVSIPTYVLLYLPRFDRHAQEASTKYFLLSVFSSALLLYGFSFLYGAVGSTNLEVLRAALWQVEPEMLPMTLTIAMVMILAGLGFRVTAVPFHFYAPDVYQGAPTVCTALLAYIPKVVGFVALINLLSGTMLTGATELGASKLTTLGASLIAIVAVASMCLGNLLGLLQDNLKRLLAYSSIAHAGYMMLGLGAGCTPGSSIGGVEAVLFYLIVYGAMTLGAFAVILHLDRPERRVETVDDLAGLARSHPLLALLMAAFLFSLIGLPPTAGFWAKLQIFFASWSTQSPLYKTLAVVMAINAAVGAWYYLRLIAAMYLRQSVKDFASSPERSGLLAIGLCGLVTLGVFIFPRSALRSAEKAAAPVTASNVAQ
jgi:NADH-quinone oxidoreductase subunit N